MGTSLKITKNEILEYSYIKLVLENCEEFKIPIKYVSDIFISAVLNASHPIQKRASYFCDNGYIRLTEDAKKILSDHGKCATSDSDRDACTLKNRLSEAKDICAIYLPRRDGQRLSITVPFDPITNLHDCELEYSNCCSVDFEEGGDVLIGIGSRSSMPKRTDNDYSSFIVDFDKIFGAFKDNRLLCKPQHIEALFYENDEKSIEVSFSCENRGFEKTVFLLEFEHFDLEYLDADLGNEELFAGERWGLDIFKTQDRGFLVTYSDFANGISFFCSKITLLSDDYY